MPRTISYAQNGEDIVLARAFKGVVDGLYVDVGANNPVLDSVTKHFYDLGWRGINIEPVTKEYNALTVERPEDTNLNIAVGRERENRLFYEAPNDGLSSFSIDHLQLQGYSEDDVNAREVEVVPLQEIFDRYVMGRTVDFLKVDVESAEDEVILSLDWEQHRPRVLVLESFHMKRGDVLEQAGYHKTLWDGINTFWVREEDAQDMTPSLSYPASTVLDSYDPWLYVSQILEARQQAAQRSDKYAPLTRGGAPPSANKYVAATRVLVSRVRLACKDLLGR